MKDFPINLLLIPIYLKSLFNTACLFFPGFFPLSSTIISKADTSGTLIKSLKNTSILLLDSLINFNINIFSQQNYNLLYIK